MVDTIAGVVDSLLRFHYDVFADVLYIRQLQNETAPSIGELTDEGDILLHEDGTNRVVGITIVSWWKRFGHGTLPDSISEISRRIEPIARKVAA